MCDLCVCMCCMCIVCMCFVCAVCFVCCVHVFCVCSVFRVLCACVFCVVCMCFVCAVCVLCVLCVCVYFVCAVCVLCVCVMGVVCVFCVFAMVSFIWRSGISAGQCLRNLTSSHGHSEGNLGPNVLGHRSCISHFDIREQGARNGCGLRATRTCLIKIYHSKKKSAVSVEKTPPSSTSCGGGVGKCAIICTSAQRMSCVAFSLHNLCCWLTAWNFLID